MTSRVRAMEGSMRDDRPGQGRTMGRVRATGGVSTGWQAGSGRDKCRVRAGQQAEKLGQGGMTGWVRVG